MTFMGYEIYNDMHLIPIYFIAILGAFLLLAVALLTHEAGHALYFLIAKKKKIKLRFEGILKCYAGEQSDYDSLTDKEYIKVNAWGVIAGLVPIIIVSTISSIYWWMIFPYILAIRQDVGELIKYTNLEE